MARGMIIAESLRSDEPLSSSLLNEIERYPMMMDGNRPVQIIMVETVCADLLKILTVLSQSILPLHYYAHFVDGESMYVVFPSTIVAVRRDNGDDEGACSDIARIFQVPESQLPYSKMFEFQHAERE